MTLLMTMRFMGLLHVAGFAHAANPRIVGGKEVRPPFSMPWMASIVYANRPSSLDGQVCGAVVIGPRHVLTAAHCAELDKNIPGMPDALAVEAGRHDLSVPAHEENPPHSVRNNVIGIHRVHPRQDVHDIAVLVVEKEYAPEIYSSIVLNDDKSLGFQTGLKVTTIGWGATDVHGRQYPHKLQRIDSEMLDHSKCDQWYTGYNRVQDFEFCAGNGGKDACFGDSGGPTFRKKGDSYEILGIESWGGQKCAIANQPGVKASVAHHHDFIQRILRDLDAPIAPVVPAAPTNAPPQQPPPNTVQCHALWDRGWFGASFCAHCNHLDHCDAGCAYECSADCQCNIYAQQPTSPIHQCSAMFGGSRWQNKCKRKCNDPNRCRGWCATRCSVECACNSHRRLGVGEKLV